VGECFQVVIEVSGVAPAIDAKDEQQRHGTKGLGHCGFWTIR
jgi:hypothetical protein